jgi:hypothetical protein
MPTKIARRAVKRVVATWTVVLMGLAAARSVEAAPIVSVGSATVGVGDLVTIPVFIDEATDLTFWQFDLAFDPAVVQANSITEGPFLSGFGATLFVPGVIDNGAGLLSLVTDAYVDLPPNPAGGGVLAEIQFLALVPGTSPLVLSNVFLNLAAQGFEIENGQITVTGPAPPTVPEPATLVLMTSGLALLAARHRARRRPNRQNHAEAGS